MSATTIDEAVRGARPAAASRGRLLDGPVLPTLLRMAAPTVALMLLQGVIAAGEAAFVGRLGSDALAGVSLSFPLVMLMTTLSAGAYGGGVASGVARSLGAGRAADAARLAGTGIGMAALLGVATTAVMLGFGRSIYTAMGATGAALDAAAAYSDVLFLGAVPFWAANAAASVLRGGGNAAYPAAAGAVTGLATLTVSPVVIFTLGFGVPGAAWAVVGNNVVMAAVLLRAVRRSPTRPGLLALVPGRAEAYAVLRVSVPSAASTVLTNLTFVVLTALVAPAGAAAVAGYGAGGRLEYLLIPVVFGVGSALVPLVAAADGAGDHARARQLTRTGALLATGACGLVGVAAAAFPSVWMGLFSDDAEVVRVGAAYLTRVGPAYAFLGTGLSLYFAAQGRGRVVKPLFATLTRLAVAGGLGAVARSAWGWGVESLFGLMAAGLTACGAVMVVVMRRELGMGVGGDARRGVGVRNPGPATDPAGGFRPAGDNPGAAATRPTTRTAGGYSWPALP